MSAATKPLRILSLGAGVQSSTLALMAALGEVPPIDAAIFADTLAEPASVYRWLDWLEREIQRSPHPFPVHRVQFKGGLDANIRESMAGGRFAGAPFFTESKTSGTEGRLRRHCTAEFKIQPITTTIRGLLGLRPRQRAPREILAHSLIGISWDEIVRMKPSRQHYIENHYPLIDRRMTRGHCLEWMQVRGYPPPPRSACYFCPYKSDSEWRKLRDDEPDEWARALDMDRLVRNGVRGTVERLYLHRSLKPLADVDLSSAEDRGQMSIFGEECEGMCGV